MRIGIDVSMIDANKAGIGYYAYSLLQALTELDTENEYFLLTYNKELINDIKLPSNFSVIEVLGTGNLKWMIKCIPIVNKLHLDQFLSPSNLFWGCILPNCTTVIHDIAQVVHPEFFYKKGNLFYKIELNILLKRKGTIIVPTKSVAAELNRKFKNIKPHVYTVTEGLHEWVFLPQSTERNIQVKQKYNLPENYVLFVGTLEPRKNIETLIRGFHEFIKENPDYKLAIAGKKGWFYEQIYRVVEDLNLSDSVIFLGYVPESDLPFVYDLSQFVVNLSFYEGFGLPLIEANARNKMILASNIDVYREFDIEGGFVDPNELPSRIALAMNELKNKNANNFARISDTYSWKLAASQLLEIWLKTAK